MEERIVKELLAELKAKSNAELAESSKRFFKEEVNFYGFKSSDVTKISKYFFKKYLVGKSKDEVLSICELLWRGKYHEEKMVACDWCYSFHREFKPSDFKVFEKWVKNYIDSWASCDVFCNHTIGDFLMMYPEFIKNTKAWTKSDNRWAKRAAAVSLIIPAKKGLFVNDVFEIADALLLDGDDMVQKGYGWMLKVLTQSNELNQNKVFDYIMENRKVMPRTALRYAIEKMPDAMKKKAMEK